MMTLVFSAHHEHADEPSDAPFLPADWPHRMSSRFVMSSGCRWHVQRTGQGPVMLLIHGTAASTHTWRDLIPPLAEHFDVIAVDLPGHAFTERLPSSSMTLSSLSSALADLLDTLDIEPAHIVGHSAGAAIALDLTLNRGVNAATLCGINAALLPFGGAMQSLFSPMAQFFATTRLMPRLLARRAKDPKAVLRVLKGTGSTLDADGLSFYQRLFQAEPHLAAVLEMMASWDLQPLVKRLPELESPLTLLVGTEDKAISPQEADKIQRVMPSLVIHRLDGLGHLAHEESPEIIAGLIRQNARGTA
ncbi:MAG: alpha/beta fold hydrolase BchO [Pseudomonadota bacterium]